MEAPESFFAKYAEKPPGGGNEPKPLGGFGFEPPKEEDNPLIGGWGRGSRPPGDPGSRPAQRFGVGPGESGQD